MKIPTPAERALTATEQRIATARQDRKAAAARKQSRQEFNADVLAAMGADTDA